MSERRKQSSDEDSDDCYSPTTPKKKKYVKNHFKKNEIRKQSKFRWSLSNMREALHAVLCNKMGYQKASELFHVPKSTLVSYSKKCRMAIETELLALDHTDTSETTDGSKPASEMLPSADSLFQNLFLADTPDVKEESQFLDQFFEEIRQMASRKSTLMAARPHPADTEMQAIPPPAPSQAPPKQMAAAQSAKVVNVSPAPVQSSSKGVISAQVAAAPPSPIQPTRGQASPRQMAVAQSDKVVNVPPAPVQASSSQVAPLHPAPVQPAPKQVSPRQMAIAQSAPMTPLPPASVQPASRQASPKQMSAVHSAQVTAVPLQGPSQMQVKIDLPVAASYPVPTQPAPSQEKVLAPPVKTDVAKPKPVGKTWPRKKRLLVVSNHSECVMSSLATLYKSGKLCDAGLGNGSSTIKVHKVVLSAVCPKLLTAFSADFFSQKFLQVNFPEKVSTGALKAFAEYMYRGVLNLDPDILEQLKIIAKRLDMKEFEKLCDSHLQNQKQPSAPSTTAASSFTSLIQTNTPIPAMNLSLASLDPAVSTSTQSDRSINTPVINVKQEISENKSVLGQESEMASLAPKSENDDGSEVASLAPNKSGNATGFIISPSIKTEWVGPEDDEYGHWGGFNGNQAFTSTSSSSSSSTIGAASTSIPASSTEFGIPFSEAIDVKSTEFETPLVSDLSSVSCFVETMCSQSNRTNVDSSEPLSRPIVSMSSIEGPSISTSNEGIYPVGLFTAGGDTLALEKVCPQSSHMNEDSSKTLSRPSVSTSIGGPLTSTSNTGVYPVGFFKARGDNLPLLTTETDDVKPFDLYQIDLT